MFIFSKSGSISAVKWNMEDFLLNVIITIVTIWSCLTGWIYALFTRPWAKLAARKVVRAVQDGETTDTEVTFKAVDVKSNQLVTDFEEGGCETVAECWDWAVERHGEKRLFGSRELIREEEEQQANGKVLKKLILGEYRWLSYVEADQLVDSMAKGLKVLGQRKNENVCILSDTRLEWMITAQACFRESFPVVTLYTNLGEDAIKHGLLETGVTTLVTSSDLLPKVNTIVDSTPNLKRIVYFEKDEETAIKSSRSDLQLISFEEVIQKGKDEAKVEALDNVKLNYPSPSSTVIIMYTSGSTGIPKGVVITHENLMSTCKSYVLATQEAELNGDDVYIGFLPLAHILELIVEMMAVIFGASIGYSGPNTLMDKSSMIKTGEKGDATILQPTLMVCVPLICNRIYKAVPQTLRQKKGSFFAKLFNFCVEYKKKAYNNGEVTPIMDKLIFKNVRKLVGGRVRAMLSGGAPLSPAVQEYMRSLFGVPLLQGYGLTETTACATIMPWTGYKTGVVGPPCPGVKLRLINWDEGNYRVTDKPWPRGEIVIGGKNISSGYFKQPEKTLEEYFTDEKGVRWFKTGDIGSVDEDGDVRIIDRKKDLVKLQGGEYVSLGKVESVLKTCSLVDNACVYGESSKTSVVALVCPNEINLNKAKEELKVDEEVVMELVLKAIIERAREAGLKTFEIPVAVKLCKELWIPDTGLVTAAFKLKRKALQDFYQRDLNALYAAASIHS